MSFDNKDNPVDEKIADAIFYYVGACHIDNISKEIEIINDNKNINPNQKELDQAIQKHIKKYRKKQRYQNFLKTSKKVSKIAAIILVVITLLSTILVSSVDALRVMFLNMFIEEKKDYSKIALEKDSLDNGNIDILLNNKELKNSYIPAYIPDNFNVEKIFNQNGTVIMIFKDYSNSLIFEQSEDLNKEYMVDTEEAHTEKILIQGQKAVIIIKDNVTTVMWKNNEKVFNVYGEVDKEEIIRFCESIYVKK